MQPARAAVPQHPEVLIAKLPFYDVQAELLKPASLIPQGSNRFQVRNY
jgi:E3 SUMO-protein ligase PIAS3